MYMNLKPNKHKRVSFKTTTTYFAPPLSAGGLSLQPNFQKGGELDKNSTFKGGIAWKEGSWGCNFHIKNKLKSEIFNDKKVYKQKYFSLS